MKKCPFCAEEVQEEAIKCKHCGEMLNSQVLQNIKSTIVGEQVLFDDRPAWNSYIPIYVWILVIAIYLGAAYKTFLLAFIFMIITMIIVSLFCVLDRLSKRYTISNMKVVVRSGIIAKSLSEIEIKDMRSINTKQGVWARILGYGDVLIGTAGTAGIEIILKGIPNPVKIKELIQNNRKN